MQHSRVCPGGHRDERRGGQGWGVLRGRLLRHCGWGQAASQGWRVRVADGRDGRARYLKDRGVRAQQARRVHRGVRRGRWGPRRARLHPVRQGSRERQAELRD